MRQTDELYHWARGEQTRNHKYVKRIPLGNGKYRYVYDDDTKASKKAYNKYKANEAERQYYQTLQEHNQSEVRTKAKSANAQREYDEVEAAGKKRVGDAEKRLEEAKKAKKKSDKKLKYDIGMLLAGKNKRLRADARGKSKTYNKEVPKNAQLDRQIKYHEQNVKDAKAHESELRKVADRKRVAVQSDQEKIHNTTTKALANAKAKMERKRKKTSLSNKLARGKYSAVNSYKKLIASYKNKKKKR